MVVFTPIPTIQAINATVTISRFEYDHLLAVRDCVPVLCIVMGVIGVICGIVFCVVSYRIHRKEE